MTALRFKKVCISGVSGTGKTTLAKHISEEYGLPYLNSSSSKLWEHYGFTNHQQVHFSSFTNAELGVRYQKEIVKLRESQLQGSNGQYVTDRGPLDLATYYLNYFQITQNTEQKWDFLNGLIRLVDYFDAFIYIKYNGNLIEDNGRRIQDPFYQLVTDSIMHRIVSENLLRISVPMIIIDQWNWDYRVKVVKHFLLR